MLLNPVTMWSAVCKETVSCIFCCHDIVLDVTELVQSEDKYTSIKTGLKALNKIDLDKLIASVCIINHFDLQ
jgi:hypothetical protein